MTTDTPRAGETWERVRDGERVVIHDHYTVDGQLRPYYTLILPDGTATERRHDLFLRYFRRVG